MKITALLFTLAASARTDGVRGYDYAQRANNTINDHRDADGALVDGNDHHLNGAGTGGGGHLEDGYDADADANLIHKDNIRADGQYGSHRNQTTRYPTPAPTAKHDAFNNMHNGSLASTGNTTVIDEQVDTAEKISNMPTKQPTAFPTKDQSDADGKGTECTDGDFTRPVGWVGAGPGNQYCNVWKCNPGKTTFSKGTDADNQGHFSKQVRRCHIQDNEDSVNFCSHTTCSFAAINLTVPTNVIKVRSDHRETVGGYHKCGLAQHGMQGGHQNNSMGEHLDNTDHSPDGRPACDCICYGMNETGNDSYGNPHVPANLRLTAPRRQDVAGFVRALNQTRVVADDHDPTINSGTYDTAHNSNNFYSKHSNNGAYTTSTIEASLQGQATTYSENDHDYAGERVAHKHVNSVV